MISIRPDLDFIRLGRDSRAWIPDLREFEGNFFTNREPSSWVSVS